MSKEEWRPVVGYEGFYSVSNKGGVRSEERTRLSPRGPVRYKGRTLTPTRHGRHLMVTLSEPSGSRRKWLVHRLVLSAFTSQPDGKPLALHLNDVGDDNRLENLYWGDYSDNMNDRTRNGIHHYASRKECKRGHPLPESYRVNTTSGRNYCGPCRNINLRNWRDRRG